MKSKIGFILYDSRSGSTMLSDLLEKYEFVFVTNETAFISRLFSLENMDDPQRIADYLFEEPQYSDLGISVDETVKLIQDSGFDIKRFSELVVLEHMTKRYGWFEDKDNQIVIVKHPPSHHLTKFEDAWPDAKAIIFVRDGRDVAVSKMKSRNLDNESFSRNIFSSAMNWNYRYRLFPTTIWDSEIVRYEDVINGDFQVGELLKAFKVSNELSSRTNKKFPVPESHRGFHKNVGTKILSNNAKKFETNGYINFVYSLTTGKLLTKFGYGQVVSLRWWRIDYLLRLVSEIFVFCFRSLGRMLRYVVEDRHRLLIAFHKVSVGMGIPHNKP